MWDKMFSISSKGDIVRLITINISWRSGCVRVVRSDDKVILNKSVPGEICWKLEPSYTYEVQWKNEC